MGASWILWLLVATLSLARQMEPLNMCTQETTIPACVLAFTPWMAPQVAPTSTYYEAIVTKHLKVSTACTIFEPGTDLTRSLTAVTAPSSTLKTTPLLL